MSDQRGTLEWRYRDVISQLGSNTDGSDITSTSEMETGQVEEEKDRQNAG